MEGDNTPYAPVSVGEQKPNFGDILENKPAPRT